MYDYWLAWRKAYHGAREWYHQSMYQFYVAEQENMKKFTEVYLDTLKSMYSFGMMQYMKILPDPGKFWK